MSSYNLTRPGDPLRDTSSSAGNHVVESVVTSLCGFWSTSCWTGVVLQSFWALARLTWSPTRISCMVSPTTSAPTPTAKRMKDDGHTSKAIAKYLGVSRATLYRYLSESGATLAFPPRTTLALSQAASRHA